MKESLINTQSVILSLNKKSMLLFQAAKATIIFVSSLQRLLWMKGDGKKFFLRCIVINKYSFKSIFCFSQKMNRD